MFNVEKELQTTNKFYTILLVKEPIVRVSEPTYKSSTKILSTMKTSENPFMDSIVIHDN